MYMYVYVVMKKNHRVNILVMLTESMEGSKWQKANNCKLFRLPTIHFQIKFYLSVKLITETVMWISNKRTLQCNSKTIKCIVRLKKTERDNLLLNFFKGSEHEKHMNDLIYILNSENHLDTSFLRKEIYREE